MLFFRSEIGFTWLEVSHMPGQRVMNDELDAFSQRGNQPGEEDEDKQHA